MEEVYFLSFHCSVQDLSTMKVLSWAKAQREDVCLGHLVDQFLGNKRAVHAEECSSAVYQRLFHAPLIPLTRRLPSLAPLE